MDSQSENTQILKLSVLRDLPDKELTELAQTLRTRVVKADEVIFKSGDPPDAFYIICSGQVRVFVRHKNRTERQFSVLGPGQHFGEISLLTGESRTAIAQGLGEATLLVVPSERFERLIRDYPELSRKFVREMRDWLLRDEKIIEEEADVLIRSTRGSWRDFIMVIGVSIFLAVSFNFLNPHGIRLIPERPDPVPLISACNALNAYQQKKAFIVDAMPNNFYRLEHIKGAYNLPPTQFDIMYMATFSKVDKGMEIIVYGSTISAPYDLETANKLLLRGFSNVKILNGGLPIWKGDGYPVEKKASK